MSNIPQHGGHAGTIRREVQVYALDLGAARRYLAGLEALAREARTSNDPRVLIAALRVAARQGKTVAELVGRGEP